MKDIINQDLNYINVDGIIIASTDPKRVGTFHAASLECVKKRKNIIIENDSQYEGSRNGINMPIYFDDSIIGVIGITGNKNEVEKFGEIIKLMTEVLVKEAWIKDQDIRKKEIIKAFIERVTLEYEHDLFPMADFSFPYVVIVGKYDINDVFLTDDDIYNILKDHFSDNKHHFFTISRNEIIILYNYYKNEKISSSIELLKKNILQKTKLNFKFGIGTNASDYKDLKLSYRNAKEILKISDVFSTSESVFEYEKMDLELLFMNLKNSNIETFKKKCLKDFSLKEIKEFSVILSVYEKFNGSITKTSEELFMHKNTLQYKLAKIKKISGYDPRNLRDFTVLSLAFKLWAIESEKVNYTEFPSQIK
jgi:hypothetical protein fulcA4_00937